MLHAHLTSTPSTNDAAQRLAMLNPHTPLLVSARTQTAGRGRQGRTWRSPPGGGWFSVAWPVTGSLHHYAPTPLAVGLAVVEVIEHIVFDTHARTLGVQLKWPNDLLIDDAKVAGILCETSVLDGLAPSLILGVGINANLDVKTLGGDLRCPAISLREACGADVPLQRLIDACGRGIELAMRRLERHGLDGDTLARIDQRLAWRGREVQLVVGEAVVHGQLDGIDPDGRIRLITDRGPARFRSGEVIRMSSYRRASDSVRSPQEVLI